MNEFFSLTTIYLCAVTVLFALLYLVTNVFFNLPLKEDRNKTMFRIIRGGLIATLISSLLSFFLTGEMNATTITNAMNVFADFTLAWLSVIVLCALSMLIILVSKRLYKVETVRAISKVFYLALTGVVIGIIFVWIFLG